MNLLAINVSSYKKRFCMVELLLQKDIGELTDLIYAIMLCKYLLIFIVWEIKV